MQSNMEKNSIKENKLIESKDVNSSKFSKKSIRKKFKKGPNLERKHECDFNNCKRRFYIEYKLKVH